MLLTMVYLLLIAALLGLAALVGEQICAALKWPRRGVWLAALAAAVALPLLALCFGSSQPGSATPLLSMPLLFDQFPLLKTGTATVQSSVPATAAFTWPDWEILETTLTALWIVSSATLLLAFLVACACIRRATTHGETIRIDAQNVLLSEQFGPAVLGFLRPQIVLPRWLAQRNSALRAQVLRHECEHIAARDQLTLLVALLLIISMPWNVPLWWQLRRLRTAIEIDCDSRVLRAGVDPREYSEALLTVGRRALRTPLPAVALIEPMSDLETRIRNMLSRTREIDAADIAVHTVLLALLLSVALAVNAPKAQPRMATGTPIPAASPAAAPLAPIRPEVEDLLAQARQCLTQAEPDHSCADLRLRELTELRGLNAHEAAQIYNFSAYFNINAHNLPAAAAAYEELIKLPHHELPQALVSSAFKGLASVYAEQQRYVDALSIYDRWLELPFAQPAGQDRFFRAQLFAMLAQYNAAIDETEQAIASTREPLETWYAQLYELQLNTGDVAGATATLELLNRHWPRDRWARALNGEAVNDDDFEPGPEYLPLTRPAPIYPPRAAQRGIEGYVIVEYTVTATGETANAVVVESSSPLFDRSAIESVKKYKYLPREIDGTPIEVAGVRTKIEYVLHNG